MFYDYKKCPCPPPCPPPYGPIPVVVKKYFYVVLFIKSTIYNVKGQAIIFRRKSLESLMKLLYDFDQTYLHTSIQNCFDKKNCMKNQNVDFLVKYCSNIDQVIALIDQNSYIIKLSWYNNVQVPECPCPPPPCPPPPYGPIPPCPPPPPIPPCPPPPYPPVPPCPPPGPAPWDMNREYIKMLYKQLNTLSGELSGTSKSKLIRITDVSGYVITYREYSPISGWSEDLQNIDMQPYYLSGQTMLYQPGDDCNLWNNGSITLIDPKDPDPSFKKYSEIISTLV